MFQAERRQGQAQALFFRIGHEAVSIRQIARALQRFRLNR
jgi:hypothetical protein